MESFKVLEQADQLVPQTIPLQGAPPECTGRGKPHKLKTIISRFCPLCLLSCETNPYTPSVTVIKHISICVKDHCQCSWQNHPQLTRCGDGWETAASSN